MEKHTDDQGLLAALDRIHGFTEAIRRGTGDDATLSGLLLAVDEFMRLDGSPGPDPDPRGSAPASARGLRP